MRKWFLLLFDLSIVSVSPFLSILIRDNFLLIWSKLYSALPYAAICVSVSCFVFVAANVHRSLLKYAGMPDYALIFRVVTVSVGITVCIVSLSGLQHGIALSVPIIQWAVIVTMMVAARFVVSSLYGTWIKKEKATLFDRENVLIIGVSDVADIYLHWARRIAGQKINVVGILDEVQPLKGRHIQSCQVIGEPVELAQILTRYRIHGISISRLIVTVPFDNLSTESQGILKYYETRGDLRFEYLDETFGGSPDNADPGDKQLEVLDVKCAYTVQALYSHRFSTRSFYPIVKRTGDIVLSFALLFALSPLILFIGMLVLIDRGYPVTFWQQRLGKDGRPFRLFKFRTMCSGIDLLGNMMPDKKRVSRLGLFLRRARLDEIPQLYNILIGEMSFVGPRPLLIADQPRAFGARLRIRPGLTGWAQVNGGKAVSKEDKAILDLWYLKNQSLYLDMRIAFLTMWTIIFGERLNPDAIQSARVDLSVLDTAGTVSKTATRTEGLLSCPSEQKVA